MVNLGGGGRLLLLDPAAAAESGPQAIQEVGLLVLVVEVAEHGANGGCGLVGVVEGDPGEQVVDDVRVNDAVEQVGSNEAKVAIDGAEVANGEVPGILAVVRNIRVGVVQVGDGDQPVVNPDVGNDPQERNRLPVKNLSRLVEDEAGDSKTNVGDDDEVGLLGKEENTPGVEVAAALVEPAFLVVVANTALVASRDVEEEVGLPAEELVGKQLDGGDNGRVLGELLKGLDGDAHFIGHLLNGARNEDEVLVDVAGEAVVAGMRDLPGEIRNTKGRVAEPADDIVQTLVPREGAVATLVGENPQAGEDAALGSAVENPESGTGSK